MGGTAVLLLAALVSLDISLRLKYILYCVSKATLIGAEGDCALVGSP